ncbi:MAG: hypothetical protein WD767_05875 [Alphaproteobacteria bacterium]
MKFFAVATRKAEFTMDQFAPVLDAEAQRARVLYGEQKVREIYSRADGKGAILVLEAVDEAEAQSYIDSLPLVQEGMLEVEMYGAIPYRGFVG